MSVVDNAPPSNPLKLMDAEPALFMMRDEEKAPATLTVPGSSNLDLILFDIVATGTVQAAVPGAITLTLYGMSKRDVDSESANPEKWLPLGIAPAEPVGGTADLPVTMWMIRGKDLMIFPGSGKMQGLFDSNVASNPIASMDLEHHPDDITPEDPLYIFAVGASFVPDVAPPPPAEGEEAEPLCTLELANFSMNA